MAERVYRLQRPVSQNFSDGNSVGVDFRFAVRENQTDRIGHFLNREVFPGNVWQTVILKYRLRLLVPEILFSSEAIFSINEQCRHK